MKKTIFMLPALALMLFAACSSEDAVTKDNTAQLNETSESAIGFDAYLTRTTTRAGWPGAMTTSTGTNNLQTEGFGVFAYYADGDLYSENAIPDFMYNQKVEYAGEWKYEPVKYWPNEFGSSAVSTGVDRVTFFAYAPYVAVDPATGQLTSDYDGTNTSKSTEIGITALTRNGKTGDPYVRYVGAFEPDKCVDLLYGVAAEDFTSKVGAADGANNIKKGDPFINVAKPEIGARLKFDFKHALSKLIVKVDADVDVVAHKDGTTPDEVKSETRVWIRSITFDGIAQRGYLNLNNGMWYEVINGNKISHASVTIHDGLRDGAEALATDEYEAPTGLNPDLVQSVGYTTTLDDGKTFPYKTVTTTGVTGVTSSNQNLFSGTGSLLVIPANEQLKVTIVYDVETADATLPNYLSDGVTKGSTVENRITKAITLGGAALKLDAGKEYTLNLHLGMTSVKFDAQVSDWTDGGTADNTWLPVNGPSIKAGTTDYPYSAPAAGGTHTFRITDLKAGSTVNTPAVTGTDIFDPDPTFAREDNVSGILTATITENTSVKKKTATITLTETGDGVTSPTTIINITQAPHPLGLGVTSVSGSAITLTGAGWDDITDATSTYGTAPNTVNRIQVKKNGTALEGVTGSVTTGQFSFAAGVITLGDALAVGDVYTITVKAGDAEPETYVAHIGGIYYSPATGSVKKYAGTYTVPAAMLVGYGSIAYEKTTAGDDVVSGFVPSTRVATLTGTATGTVNFNATLTPTSKPGWHYLGSNPTATFTLTVED